MYQDITKFVSGCPECAIVSGGGKVGKPPLYPIPVRRPFQIVGVDIMALPKTTRGNKYVLVLQDFLSKWPSHTVSASSSTCENFGGGGSTSIWVPEAFCQTG